MTNGFEAFIEESRMTEFLNDMEDMERYVRNEGNEPKKKEMLDFFMEIGIGHIFSPEIGDKYVQNKKFGPIYNSGLVEKMDNGNYVLSNEGRETWFGLNEISVNLQTKN